ncbi:MAG: C40 family peptidase [Lachnospiraceae bacterium]|nr:C40 family peptidase [Lachnospiraceae bacterium]
MVGKFYKRITIIAAAIFFAVLITSCVILGLKNDKKVSATKLSELEEPIEAVNETDSVAELASVEEKPNFSVFLYPESSKSMVVRTPEIPALTSENSQNDVDFSMTEAVYTVCADELVEWAFRAYNEEWEYVTAGCEEGHVDCSGLIKSCVGICARGTEELLAESELKGEISTIPDIPGLGVYMSGHVGIYVGGGMVIDARTEDSGVGYDAVDYEAWTDWFEIKGVDYSKYSVDFE